MDDTNSFRNTYLALEADMREIAEVVQSIPLNARPGTAHIDHTSAMTQYAFYAALMRKWLPNPDSAILDWGGQHGQVTRLLSHFYPNTTCYVLADDAYDRRYGLADWHSRLKIERVVRSSDPQVLNIADCSYDAVISSGVLEHVGECGVSEVDALSELYRVLKPNGLLFIWNLPRQFGREWVYPFLHRTAHPRRFRKQEIIELLTKAGFSVQYVRCHELLPLSILKRLELIFSPYTLIHCDYALSERIGLLAQNFTVIAKR
jgi:SAM-dependent methyltransferase